MCRALTSRWFLSPSHPSYLLKLLLFSQASYLFSRACPHRLAANPAGRDAKDTKQAALAAHVAKALSISGGATGVHWVRLYDTLAAMRAEATHTNSSASANASASASAAKGPLVQMPDGYTHQLFKQIEHQVGMVGGNP
jgi:hypothetical protein